MESLIEYVGLNCYVHAVGGGWAYRVSSRALRGTQVTAITEGKNKHNDDVLLASDRDGRLAVWNLSLFKMQCLDLPLELVTAGFHHPEDPGAPPRQGG